MKYPLAAFLIALACPALAADYFMVVPVHGRSGPGPGIAITLSPATLPNGIAGQPYAGFDLNTVVQVMGDPSYGQGRVAWRIASGALPSGLQLQSNGLIAGTPTVAGSRTAQISASYKGEQASQDYSIAVNKQLALFGDIRAWSDGTAAVSCKSYRTSPDYAGATGDGLYLIDVLASGATRAVLCDMTTEGGGWTVFQARVDGHVDFYRDWASYADGFGDSREYWLGNDRLSALTAAGSELLIELTRTTGETAWARYNSFRVASATDKYRLNVGGYSGTAGDSFSWHSGQMFSTRDQANDQLSGTNRCAQQYLGAWWYGDCHAANLNGQYLNGPHQGYGTGMNWSSFTGFHESLRATTMKMRER